MKMIRWAPYTQTQNEDVQLNIQALKNLSIQILQVNGLADIKSCQEYNLLDQSKLNHASKRIIQKINKNFKSILR